MVFLKINETCFNTQSTYFRTRQGEARKRLSAERYHPINLFPNPKV